MYKTKKAFLSILLIISILFISTTANYKKTEASVVVVAGAVTVGALILTAVTMVASHNGIKLNIPDKDEFTKFMADFFTTRSTTNSEVSTWWNYIKNMAFDTGDTTKTMNNTFIQGVSSLFKYAIKSTIGFYLTLNQSVIEAIQDGIKEFYGYTTLTPGMVNTVVKSDVEQILLNNHVQSFGPDTVYSYPYVTVCFTPNNTLTVFGSMLPLTLQAENNNVNMYGGTNTQLYVSLYLSTSGTYTYLRDQTLNEATINGLSIRSGGVIYFYGELINLSNWNGIYEQNLTKLLYNSYEMECFDRLGFIYKISADAKSYNIDAGVYDTDLSQGAVIGVNPYLEDTLKNLLNIDNVAESTNTDAIARAIDIADIAAEKVGTDVVSVDLTDTTAVGNPIDTANEWYDVILNPLKQFAKWLFVPDKVVVNELIDAVQTKMDEQAGLLTYPLTLVIRFLMEVSQLDVTDCILHIPKMEIFGYKFYDGYYFNLTQEIHKSDYAQIYTVYMYFTDFIMIIGFISLCIKKGDEMMKGGISPS